MTRPDLPLLGTTAQASLFAPELIHARPEPAMTSLERLLLTLESHVEAETAAMGSYQLLTESSGDPLVGILMRMVLEDEIHHHELLRRMVATLEAGLYWTHPDHQLPVEPAPQPSEAARERLVNAAHELVREELDGSKHLRALAQREPTLYGGLYALLLDVMARDSDKHALILRFVERRLRGDR